MTTPHIHEADTAQSIELADAGGIPTASEQSSRQPERHRVLTVHECLGYLHSRDLGRLAFRTGEDVEVLPVNYATDGRIVVFRTGSLTMLQRSTRGRVTFEVDSWDPESEVGWSVELKGVAREVMAETDPFSKALRQNSVLPLAPGKREHWIAIYPSEITGRRFRNRAN